MHARNIKIAAERESRGLLLKTSFQLALLSFIVILTFFLNLGKADPSIMEARNFITVREMTQNGTWLIPTMNGYARLAKPPLPTWITALSGIGARDIDNLAVLRFPSSVMAGLTVFFLYFLTRMLTLDRLIPFLAALVLTSSLLFDIVGRQATWDIYCHSFMLGAIWLLIAALRKPGRHHFLFVASGVLLGCSFLSKGPVAFYTLLLPFLLAYGYAYPLQVIKEKRSGMLLMLLVCLLICFSWPMYAYIIKPADLTHNVSQETTAWVNRHVKPVWYYWGFIFQTGIWSLFAVAALTVPYARSRVGQYGNYKFLFSWVLVSFILLSIIPEKKERYLLPVIIPLALLTAHYLRYLIKVFSEKKLNNWERGMLNVSGFLFALIAFAVPAYLFIANNKLQAISGGQLFAMASLFVLLGGAILVLTMWYKIIYLFVAGALLNALVLVFIVPLYKEMKEFTARQRGVPELEEVSKRVELKSMEFYAVGGMRPEGIWKVGREVATLKISEGHLQLPSELPAVVFSLTPLHQADLTEAGTGLQFVSLYQFMDNVASEKYYMYILFGSSKECSNAPMDENVQTLVH